MLLFELFPAVFAVVALIVGVMLWAVNHRTRHDPHEQEPPRSPSRPSVAPGTATMADDTAPRRPSMRA